MSSKQTGAWAATEAAIGGRLVSVFELRSHPVPGDEKRPRLLPARTPSDERSRQPEDGPGSSKRR